MGNWGPITTAANLRSLAPAAFEALDQMRSRAHGSGLDRHLAASEAVTIYSEQFNLDVSSLTSTHREAAGAVLGDDLFGFVQAVWALDMADRIDQACRQLAPTTVLRDAPADEAEPTRTPSTPTGPEEMWASVEGFINAVARLTVLDPLTTEVVRLRGARAHDCRLCKSLRNVAAVGAGADEKTFDAIDLYETSRLDERLKVALRLTDAVIWEPRSWADGLADQVRETFSPAEAVELVLDVTRNAANRIAVALEADQANVTEGVEYFSMDKAGVITYGLEAPTRAT